MPYARLLALAAGSLLLAAAGWAHAWVTTLPETDIIYGDFGNGVTHMLVLADGDIMASGDGDEEVSGVVARFDLATGAYRPFSYAGFCQNPGGIAQMPDGDVVVNGSANGDCDASPEWFVTRYDANGWKRWTFHVEGVGRAIAHGGDDVLVVGGSTYGFLLPEQFAVARLDPATGAIIWTADPNGTVRHLAVDSAGDVYTEVDRTLDGRMGVVKRSASDGSELWRYAPVEESFTARVSRIFIDANDDVIVAGQLTQSEAEPDPPALPRDRVVKLKGDTGEVLWTHEYVASWSPANPAAALAPNGDVIAAGVVVGGGDPHWRVERLDAGDGVPLWVNDDLGAGVSSIAMTPDGDVVTTGGGSGIKTLRLRGSDGTRMWLSHVEPHCTHGEGGSEGTQVGVAPDGTVIAGGRLCTDYDYDRGNMTVLALRGDDGTLLVPPTTTSTTVSTTTTTPSTTTTSTTLPDGLCATLQRSGCLDDGTPRRLRRRLARLCAAEPGTAIARRRMRRVERRLARIERTERLPAACLESLSRHLATSR
jgi:hypothetical protein